MAMATRSKKLVIRSAADDPKCAIISTSDRNAFRTCRRKWNWSSHLRFGYRPHEQAKPLWFGSGWHHWLEDFHGSKLYASAGDPAGIAALDDYAQATRRHHGVDNLPETFADDVVLMKEMASHYVDGWLAKRGRDPLKTFFVGDEPQVEVPFEFEIPLPKDVLSRTSKYKRAVYKGVIDRVVVDSDGYLWLVDYKSVAAFTNSDHLELDSQIGTYLWAAHYIYRRPVLGFIYMQFKKKAPSAPKVLASGELSADKGQATTHALYRAAAVEKYGTESRSWPAKIVETVNYLAGQEMEEEDNFIRRTRVTRAPATMEMEAMKILAEVGEMLNPSLPIYPSPSFMCPNTCSFLNVCLEMDRGEDYHGSLEADFYQQQYGERNDWRKYLKIGRKDDKPIVQVVAPNTKKLDFKQAARRASTVATQSKGKG